MTIKQLHEIAGKHERFEIVGFDSMIYKINRHDPLQMMAFQNFSIESIEASETQTIQITLKFQPVIEE